MTSKTDWVRVAEKLPPEGVVVETMSPGGRHSKLVFDSNLWWFPDHSMYIYYVPAAWKFLDSVAEVGGMNRGYPSGGPASDALPNPADPGPAGAGQREGSAWIICKRLIPVGQAFGLSHGERVLNVEWPDPRDNRDGDGLMTVYVLALCGEEVADHG